MIHCLFHYRKATAEVKELLKDSLNWKNYTELDYYKDFDPELQAETGNKKIN